MPSEFKTYEPFAEWTLFQSTMIKFHLQGKRIIRRKLSGTGSERSRIKVFFEEMNVPASLYKTLFNELHGITKGAYIVDQPRTIGDYIKRHRGRSYLTRYFKILDLIANLATEEIWQMEAESVVGTTCSLCGRRDPEKEEGEL